eukprot:TRINITY_DN3156_c1_g1_i1.p1 TRINITY_DN3156_c1_g1~~TRINITY_DN3156_c1_g1_i1.p1  ORF type:complete len:956 (+),score=284.91 TRINITY_DN3156_c1_g1_i1:119-2869(+)
MARPGASAGQLMMHAEQNTVAMAFRQVETADSRTERQARLSGVKKEELRRYQRMFRIFDQNGDGTIDLGELHYLLDALGVEMSDAEVRALIMQSDRDCSGTVELEEFLEIILDAGAKAANTNWTGLVDKVKEDVDMFRKSDDARTHVEMAMECNRFLPDSVLRQALDGATLAILLYYFAAVGLHISGKFTHTPGVYAVEAFFTLVLVADIVLRFDTAVDWHHQLVTDRRQIAELYVKGWLFVDVLGTLPLDLVLFASGAVPVAATLCYLFRLVRLLRLPSLFQKTSRGLMTRGYVTWHFRNVPWIKRASYTAIALHVLTVIWLLMHEDTYPYVNALYFVMYTVTTVGYGDIEVHSERDRLYCCFLFAVGICAQGILIGYLTSYVMRSDINSDRTEKMNQTLAVLHHFGVPEGLQEEILAYEYHLLQFNLSVSYTEVIAGLPFAMQDQVSLYIRIRFIMQVPMFTQGESAVRTALAQSLKNVAVPPEEYIIVAGEEGHEMFFLVHGFSDVTTPHGAWLATIAKGGFFGEVALLIETRRTANIIALTFCDLFVMRKEDFDGILMQYPSFAEQMSEIIAKRKAQAEQKEQAAREEQRCKLARSPLHPNFLPIVNGAAGANEGADLSERVGSKDDPAESESRSAGSGNSGVPRNSGAQKEAAQWFSGLSDERLQQTAVSGHLLRTLRTFGAHASTAKRKSTAIRTGTDAELGDLAERIASGRTPESSPALPGGTPSPAPLRSTGASSDTRGDGTRKSIGATRGSMRAGGRRASVAPGPAGAPFVGAFTYSGHHTADDGGGASEAIAAEVRRQLQRQGAEAAERHEELLGQFRAVLSRVEEVASWLQPAADAGSRPQNALDAHLSTARMREAGAAPDAVRAPGRSESVVASSPTAARGKAARRKKEKGEKGEKGDKGERGE